MNAQRDEPQAHLIPFEDDDDEDRFETREKRARVAAFNKCCRYYNMKVSQSRPSNPMAAASAPKAAPAPAALPSLMAPMAALPQIDHHSFNDFMEAFQQAGRISIAIGSSVILQEAEQVRLHLTKVKTAAAASKRKTEAEEHQQKRRKLNTSDGHQEAGGREEDEINLAENAANALNEEEKSTIWNQTVRMKRMSAMLKDIEMMQRVLLQEMKECHADRTENREPA